MNQDLQALLDIIKQSDDLSEEEKNKISGLIKKVDNELMITSFKLDRTEKVKRTTSILLEETIDELEKKRADVEQANAALKKSLEDLKSAQAQLIHSEKMASLGELTAGIAHEIQNPLNFVNNFSEVNAELIDELIAERSKVKGERNEKLEIELLKNLLENEQKIQHHGKRAGSIVKGMLQHSRASSGQKELTDINALCDEYLRLAFHGFRAKDKSFNAEYKMELDPDLPKINVVPQDIGRVLLNLINNAFYAVDRKSKESQSDYKPLVEVSTKLSPSRGGQVEDKIEISVKDNGPGIPEQLREKIFQPFFTTKPSGQGTGLGLSLSYDIITKGHGGELKVESREGEGSRFIIHLAV